MSRGKARGHFPDPTKSILVVLECYILIHQDWTDVREREFLPRRIHRGRVVTG